MTIKEINAPSKYNNTLSILEKVNSITTITTNTVVIINKVSIAPKYSKFPKILGMTYPVAFFI